MLLPLRHVAAIPRSPFFCVRKLYHTPKLVDSCRGGYTQQVRTSTELVCRNDNKLTKVCAATAYSQYCISRPPLGLSCCRQNNSAAHDILRNLETAAKYATARKTISSLSYRYVDTQFQAFRAQLQKQAC